MAQPLGLAGPSVCALQRPVNDRSEDPRRKAQACREQANDMPTEAARLALLAIADQYEAMAGSLEADD